MRTTALLLAWVALGLTVEAVAWHDRIQASIHRQLQQAAVEKQQAIDRERWIANRNLEQAETFIRMCLDQETRYAYLGPLVVECKATVTKYKLYM